MSSTHGLRQARVLSHSWNHTLFSTQWHYPVSVLQSCSKGIWWSWWGVRRAGKNLTTKMGSFMVLCFSAGAWAEYGIMFYVQNEGFYGAGIRGRPPGSSKGGEKWRKTFFGAFLIIWKVFAARLTIYETPAMCQSPVHVGAVGKACLPLVLSFCVFATSLFMTDPIHCICICFYICILCLPILY